MQLGHKGARAMSRLFPVYYLDQRRKGQLITISRKDYWLAGLFASLYVLWRTNLRTFAKAFLANLLFLALAALALLAASALPAALGLMAVAVAITSLGIEQSRTMVRYVVQHYKNRGWDLTPG